jgi:hypothetical protein
MLELTRNSLFRYPLINIFLLLTAAAFLAGSISFTGELTHRSQVTQMAAASEYYASAYKRFKLFYQSEPGDMINATAHWPDCQGGSADCNGSGDRRISSIKGDNTPETALAWQHLTLAGLVKAPAKGMLVEGYYMPGENMPATEDGLAGYAIVKDIPYHQASWSDAHYLAVTGKSDWQLNQPGVTAHDARELDIKLDDGIASSGKIFAYGKAGACLQSTQREILINRIAADYVEEYSAQPHCRLYFQLPQ